jgi:sugar phosphate isomerase/epimerase
MATEPEDEIYKEHMEYLKRCINIAKELELIQVNKLKRRGDWK